VVILAENRINSCQLFSESRCPHQTEMERLYLIPQLLDADKIEAYENTCYPCALYMNRFLVLAEFQPDTFTREAKIGA
jgi:hypothetical protein